jgi:molybdopterin-binding protein
MSAGLRRIGMSLHIDVRNPRSHALIWRRNVATVQENTMKTSARNQFAGIVKEMTKGPVSTELTREVASGINVVAVISTRSAEMLGLAVGKRGYALIKANNVMIAVN